MQKSRRRYCTGSAMRIRKAHWLCWLLMTASFSVQAQSYLSLKDKVSVVLDNTTVHAIVQALENQTKYQFVYDPGYLDQCSITSVKFGSSTVGLVLEWLDQHTAVDITYTGNTIAFRKGVAEGTSAAKGRIAGKVVDAKNEALADVTVQVDSKQAQITGVDGSYAFQLEPGVYTVSFTHIAYESQKITDVRVKRQETTKLDIGLKNPNGHLKEVTVTSSYNRASVDHLYNFQKNNAAMSNGISADVIARTPDKHIGEVLKRISGVSTVENKYVVVRGLSERYNQAILNGQIMPSTELNRKTFSFDLIPANLVENVIVTKTLTPDRSADFGGGILEINTIDIPAANFFNVSVGAAYNDKTTGKAFLSLAREHREYLASTPSHRKILDRLDWNSSKEFATAFNGVDKKGQALSNNWGLYRYNAALSPNFQLTGGRILKSGEKSQWGAVATLSYRNTIQTQDVTMSRDGWGVVNASPSEYAGYHGKRYGFTTSIGGLVGIGYRTKTHRIGYQSLLIRNLDEQLVIGNGSAASGGIQMGLYDLASQTTLLQQLLRGEHAIGNKGIKFKWSGSYTWLDRQKPDNHNLVTPFIMPDSTQLNGYNIQQAGSNGLSSGAWRWWNRALEKSFNWDATLSAPFSTHLGKTPIHVTARAGYSGWNKDRKFYVINVGETFDNPGSYYLPLATAFTTDNNVGAYYSRFGDDFHRKAWLHAGFGMVDMKAGPVRLVGGARMEYYNLNNANAMLDSLFRQINASRGGNEQYDYSELKNRELNWHFFPSVNLTWSITPAMDLRFAYAKSIIRPDLRELSYFREYDFELGGIYQSQLVRSTLAKHVDLRYEWYPGPGEVMSLSLFYKKFDYPMEIYADEQSGGVYDLRNNKSAGNYGLEIEMRKSLKFTGVPLLKNITLYGNFTALDAYVTPMKVNYNALDPNNPLHVSPVETYGAREKRPQTGASNYLVNGGVFYDQQLFSLSLLYNYVSNRMFRPDANYVYSIFERPLETLDMQLAVHLLKQRADVRLNIANLLNRASLVYKNRYDGDLNTQKPSTHDLLYQAGTDQIDYQGRPGRTYSMTFSYKF